MKGVLITVAVVMDHLFCPTCKGTGCVGKVSGFRHSETGVVGQGGFELGWGFLCVPLITPEIVSA
jgi:hypothetical protein